MDEQLERMGRPRFGYTPGSFHARCHQFGRDPDSQFVGMLSDGSHTQPRKSKAHDLVAALCKQNHSVFEISNALKEHGVPLSPTAVRDEGFAPLPRRGDVERLDHLGAIIEAVADVHKFALQPGARFTTRCEVLFTFLPDLVRLLLDQFASGAGYWPPPG